jgi:hypothetical protein
MEPPDGVYRFRKRSPEGAKRIPGKSWIRRYRPFRLHAVSLRTTRNRGGATRFPKNPPMTLPLYPGYTLYAIAARSHRLSDFSAARISMLC